ncbi:MAG: DUF4919 domain-containing protein [Bacteroidota bacterium]
MKKDICLIVLLFFVPVLTFSQDLEIESVNFRKIKKEIKKKRSPYYYPGLYQRYLDLDTSLNAMDFRYLYYGFSFQQAYCPYGTPILRDSLISYLQREDPLQAELEVAAKLAGELLRESPFRLRETFIAAVAFEMSGNEAMSAIYYGFFEKQVEAIMSSGDGLTKETAFTVIYIPDEYEILEVLGFSFGGGQSLTEDNYDLLQLEQNPYEISELYFNVNRLIEVGF